MMQERVRLHFHDDGTVEESGIDQPRAELWKGNEATQYVILKVPGHNYWSGRGEQSYAPAEFHVFENREDEYGWYTPVVSFPIRRKETRRPHGSE